MLGDNGKIKTTNQVASSVLWEPTMNKPVQLLKLLVKTVQMENIPIKLVKQRAKTIAVLDHLLLPINLLVSNVSKDNIKTKTTNQSAKFAYWDNTVIQPTKRRAKMTVVLDRTLILTEQLVLIVKKDSGKI